MLSVSLLALCPVALLIALGVFLKQTTFQEELLWRGMERLCYYVLLPSLIIYSLTSADFGELELFNFSMALIVSTLLIAVLLIVLRYFFAIGGDGPTFTSVFQGGIRYNNYVGLSVASTLFGQTGVTLVIVANAVLVPIINIICILVFAHYCTTKSSFGGVLKQIVFNPLVSSCVIGSLMQIMGVQFPEVINSMMHSLGRAALPLGLLCIGAALQLNSIKGEFAPILVASGMKLILLPLVALIVLTIFDLKGPELVVGLLMLVLPTATSSYILSRQLNGNAHLMAGIIAIQTITAMVTIPIVLTLGDFLNTSAQALSH